LYRKKKKNGKRRRFHLPYSSLQAFSLIELIKYCGILALAANSAMTLVYLRDEKDNSYLDQEDQQIKRVSSIKKR
jgi:hypothetical protein